MGERTSMGAALAAQRMAVPSTGAPRERKNSRIAMEPPRAAEERMSRLTGQPRSMR